MNRPNLTGKNWFWKSLHSNYNIPLYFKLRIDNELLAFMFHAQMPLLSHVLHSAFWTCLWLEHMKVCNNWNTVTHLLWIVHYLLFRQYRITGLELNRVWLILVLKAILKLPNAIKGWCSLTEWKYFWNCISEDHYGGSKLSTETQKNSIIYQLPDVSFVYDQETYGFSA